MRIPKKSAMTPRRFGVLFAAVALLMSTGLVSADTNTIDFESADYDTGSIQGQDGWSGSGVTPISTLIDQEIVTNESAPESFQGQSWRFSNAYTDGAFGHWPFSPSLAAEAGETTAENGGFSTGPRQTRFDVEFEFTSAAPEGEQDGLQMSTAPDRGDGARMSFIRLEDLEDGLSVDFVDYQRGVNETPCVLGTNFIEHNVASELTRGEAHSVRLVMDFVDGPSNDVVTVYIDGTQVLIGTSWEDYYRDCEDNPPRTVDSMIFQARSGGGTAPGTLGEGFLIDNLSYTSSIRSVAANRDDCRDGGWEDVTRADGSAFKNQGDCMQYVHSGK